MRINFLDCFQMLISKNILDSATQGYQLLNAFKPRHFSLVYRSNKEKETHDEECFYLFTSSATLTSTHIAFCISALDS